MADEPGADAAPERHDVTDAYVYDSEPRNRKLWAAVAILVLAVIGTGGAYTYRLMVGGEEQQQQSPPPVIHADTSPKKIASATQQSNNDKQIQDRLGASGAGEKLVPREEQPLAIKNPNAQSLVPETPPSLSAPVTTEPSNARPFPAAPGEAASEPKKIRTVTIRPDGNSGSTAPSQAGAPAAAVPAAPVPASPAPAKPASSGGEPQSAAPQAPARTQTAVVTPQPRPTTPTTHNYVVQISAQRSQADAESSFRIMQAKYPSVLGGRQPIIQRKESSRGVYYGTQVGPFASRADAIQLCEELKAAGGNCFVQRN
ncbi:MAG: SPOR domain-containing protein [Xanthobacteraceae bacterium]